MNGDVGGVAKELALLLFEARALVDDPESQNFLLPFAFGVVGQDPSSEWVLLLFIREKVDLPGVGNKLSQVKRVASEFEIPLPLVVLWSSGRSRPMNTAANNNSSNRNKAGMF